MLLARTYSWTKEGHVNAPLHPVRESQDRFHWCRFILNTHVWLSQQTIELFELFVNSSWIAFDEIWTSFVAIRIWCKQYFFATPHVNMIYLVSIFKILKPSDFLHLLLVLIQKLNVNHVNVSWFTSLKTKGGSSPKMNVFWSFTHPQSVSRRTFKKIFKNIN